jgi:hypothetical protein
VNDTDSFSYRILDSTGRASQVVTVTFTLNQSRYQNPLTDLSEDVNADGEISAIDALRVINFLNRALVDDTAISVPVSEIGDPPPDYYDANGDGRVSAGDALQVINKLRRVSGPQGELAEGESVSSQAASALTTSFVAPALAGLPVRNLEPTSDDDRDSNPHDVLLASGFEISSQLTEQVIQAVSTDSPAEQTSDSVDQALSLILDEFTLSDELD